MVDDDMEPNTPYSLVYGSDTTVRDELAEAAKAIEPRLTIHDFRIVDGPTHTNVIFDAVLPNDSALTEDECRAALETLVHSLWKNSHPKVHIDRPFA